MYADDPTGDRMVPQHDTDASRGNNADQIRTDGGEDIPPEEEMETPSDVPVISPNDQTTLNFNYDDLYYIRIAADSKYPKDKWGGYSQDFTKANDVFTHEEVLQSLHGRWGIVGIDAPDHHNWNLFILDLDIHKTDKYDFEDIVIDAAEKVPIVKSQNDGVHLYFALHDSVTVSDIDLEYDWIDLRGDAVKSHVVAPGDLPGCEDSAYELRNDASVPVFLNVGEVLDRVYIDGETIGAHTPGDPIDVDFERSEVPDEMPTCYHAALSFRASENRSEHPNGFKIDTFAGLLGLAAGYSVDEVTADFGEYPPFGDHESFDESLTRDHLERLARKLDSDELVPPALSTLQQHGVLQPDESCTCQIDYHGAKIAPESDDEPGSGVNKFSASSLLKFEGDTTGYYQEVKDKDGNEKQVWKKVANFRIETKAFLFEEKQRLLELEIVPCTGEPSYDVTVPASVFNDARKFKNNVVTGITTTWEGSAKLKHLEALRKLVGSQEAPVRTGTEIMGLKPEDSEFVTPAGVIAEDGWTDNPKNVYIEQGTSLENSWGPTPESHPDYDVEAVLEIVELAMQMRNKDRLLPVLSWLYTAPLRPYLQKWEGQFNPIHISGESGAGKSMSLKLINKMAGLDGVPMKVDNTKFTLLTLLSSTDSIPVWFDEYKPAELADYELNRFNSLLRDTATGNTGARGNKDKTTEEYLLQAPVMISGEQELQGNAEERRTIQLRFLKNVQRKGSETAVSFSELAGEDYVNTDDERQYPAGKDLQQHALAYYQFITSLDEDELRSIWRDAREHVSDLLDERELVVEESLPRQGLQTIWFGMSLSRRFVEMLADKCGQSPSGVVASENEVDEAIVYAAKEILGEFGRRKNHLDDWLELLSRAANAGYLEVGTHYDMVHEHSMQQELALHLATCHDAVSKYVRDHDIDDVDLLNSSADYRSWMKDHAEDNGGYVISHSQPTTSMNRCARIDPAALSDTLDFNFTGFGVDVVFPKTRDNATDDNAGVSDEDENTIFSDSKKVLRAIINQMGQDTGKPTFDRIKSVADLDECETEKALGELMIDGKVVLKGDEYHTATQSNGSE